MQKLKMQEELLKWRDLGIKVLQMEYLFLNYCVVEPRVMKWYIVIKGENEKEQRLNATYIIIVEMKLGC